MREQLLKAFRGYVSGKVEYHRANIEVYLANPAGIGEHPDIMEAIESEMRKLAEYEDMLEMSHKFFPVK